jgi:hypothetical protein
LITNKGKHTKINIGHLADSVKFGNVHMNIKVNKTAPIQQNRVILGTKTAHIN